MQTKKLFLLDGMALIYRAHFALSKNPRFTSSGFNTSAVLGFTNTLLELIKKENPSHMAVVFDTAAPTSRHLEFESYKAHREAMPEDLALALPYVFKLIEGFNIPLITKDGFEADDIIGTLAKEGERNGFTVFCVTPDKDFGQLVSENIFIYKPARMGNDVEIQGVPEILAKWEIENVSQVIDILGLWGDAVDNIPGIPGVGEKTAKTLIQQFGSMENIFENTHLLKGKLKENLENFKEQGLISKRLATIWLDVPVEFNEQALLMEKPNRDVLEPLFAELEFRTLGKRVFGEDFSVPEAKVAPNRQQDLFSSFNTNPTTNSSANATTNSAAITEDFEEEKPAGLNIDNNPHQYHIIESAADRAQLIQNLNQAKEFAFDTETTGTDANACELVGLSFAMEKGIAYYVPLPEDRTQVMAILEEFRHALENPEISKIGQNIKYDLLVLKWYGFTLKGELFDTMLAHYLIDPDTRHNMDILAENYLNYSPISITTLIGSKGKAQGNMRDVPLDKIAPYAAEDADIAYQLAQVFKPLLHEKKAYDLATEVEYPLIEVLADMEKEGVNIDVEALHHYSISLQEEISLAEEKVYEKTGLKFNLASPKQLGEVLFDHLKLDPKAKKTKTGQYQTGEDVLLALANKSDIVKDILDFRQLQKLKSTYVDALPLLVNKRTHRIHTSYNQAVAATGRLSSNNPNLQNIPIKTERGREVRKAFIPRDAEHLILSADYSQIELRIIAEISQEENMLAAFNDGLDIHTATAARVYDIPLEQVDNLQRRNAKAVNFGIIYGQSAFGLSQNLNIPRKEAAAIIEQYFTQYPGIKRYMSDTMNFARENGYVETILGRRRYLRDINSANMTVRGFAERNAINAPIQGSAADLIKVAMIHISKELQAQKFKSKMTMQVHDELVFDAHRSEIDALKELVIRNMKNAIPLNVPIVVEVGVGENWLAAH